MKSIVFCVLLIALAVDAKSRNKREAYALPDGAEALLGAVKTVFTCPPDAVGYFADTDNNCKIFHVCHTIVKEDGSSVTKQYSFMCGNLTMFDQLTFSCSTPEDAIPCSEAPNFYYLNDNLRSGDPQAYFLSDQDIERAAAYIVKYSANAVESAAGQGGSGRPGGPRG